MRWHICRLLAIMLGMEQDIRKWVSNRIRGLRLKKGLTQQELAERAELDYKSIQRLEGKSSQFYPKVNTLEKVAKVFGLSLPSFFKGR